MLKSIFVLMLPLFFLYADMEKPAPDTTIHTEVKEMSTHTTWNRDESIRSRDTRDEDRKKLETERENRIQKTADERDRSANTAS
jgi:hypothetical protein